MFIINAWRQVWKCALLLCILPFVLLGFFNHPSIHDGYRNANILLKEGAYGFIKMHYLGWTGRYTELIVKAALSPLTYQNSLFLEKALAICMLLAMLLAFYVACAMVLNRRDGFHLGLLMMILFICGLTNVGAVFYWSGGSTAYTIGLVFSVLFLGFLYGLKTTGSKLCLLLSALFAFLAIGCYDVITMAILWIATTNLVYSWFSKKGFANALTLFVAVLVSASLAIFSPGNVARAASVHNEASVFSVTKLVVAALKSMFFTVGTTIGWLDSALLMLGTIIVLQLINRNGRVEFFSLKVPALVVGLWLLVGASLSIFPAIFAYQAAGEHTWQCVYFFFLIGWLLLANQLFGSLDHRYHVGAVLLQPGMVRGCQLAFVLLVFIGSTSNINIAYMDLLKAREFERRSQQRVALMQEAAREHSVGAVEPLFVQGESYMVPKTLFTVEYNEADAAAFAAYYGVDSATVNPCFLVK